MQGNDTKQYILLLVFLLNSSDDALGSNTSKDSRIHLAHMLTLYREQKFSYKISHVGTSQATCRASDGRIPCKQ